MVGVGVESAVEDYQPPFGVRVAVGVAAVGAGCVDVAEEAVYGLADGEELGAEPAYYALAAAGVVVMERGCVGCGGVVYVVYVV